jgi:hypothetical protein
MTRAQVEQLLPPWKCEVDCMGGAGDVSYYFISQDWRVQVKYDNTGSEGNFSNRVVSPVRLDKQNHGGIRTIVMGFRKIDVGK